MSIRLALVCDYVEEGWASMDLVGDMILEHLRAGHAGEVEATRVRPAFRHRLGRLPAGRFRGAARNVDRLWNRFGDYPRAARKLGDFDAYHLVDHSYSQLLHALPPGRAVVTCHDLDTFRCLLEPRREPRPRWFRAMAGRILSGFRKAAAVACVSTATRDALAERDLFPADRLHVIPNGIPDEFRADPDPAADAEAAALLGPPGPADLLHVGSTIPRKRIDLLLAIFAAIREARPDARLIRVGLPFTPEQARLADDLGLGGAIVALHGLSRPTLAAIYRRAALVLQPSEAEGFGLPVAEALACGAPVLASAIPALVEVGGEAVAYRPVGDIPAWQGAALALLEEGPDARRARREAGIAGAGRYRWAAHVERLIPLYRAAAEGRR